MTSLFRKSLALLGATLLLVALLPLSSAQELTGAGGGGDVTPKGQGGTPSGNGHGPDSAQFPDGGGRPGGSPIPGDTVGPGSGGPTPSNPKPDSGPGGATEAGPAPGGVPKPVLPGGGNAPGAGPTAQPPPTAGPPSFTPSGAEATTPEESWTRWWDLVQGDLLGLERAVRTGTVRTGSSDFFLGRGQRENAAPPDGGAGSVSPAVVAGEIVPLLLELAEADHDHRVTSESLIALGRTLPHATASQVEQFVALCERELASGSRPESEAAAIALGAGGSQRSLSLLRALLGDTRRGRQVAGGGEVPHRLRALSGYALGFVARRTDNEDVRRLVAHTLAQAIEQNAAEAQPDVAVACLYGLAMVPLERVAPLVVAEGVEEPPSASRTALVRHLLGPLGERDTHPLVRANVPTAVALAFSQLEPADAALLAPAVAKPLLQIAEDRRTEDNAVVRGAALALGFLGDSDGDPTDASVREALWDLADASDQPTRHFALLSLGRIAGRGGIGVDPASARDALLVELLREVARGRNDSRPYAALGVGLAASELREDGHDPHDSWVLAMQEALREAAGPVELAAVAVGAGLVGDDRLLPPLVDAFDKLPEGDLRGRGAVAIGLVGSSAALETLRDWQGLQDSRPTSMRRAAEARLLCGDPFVSSDLASALTRNASTTARIGVLDAVAEVGDPASVPAVLSAASDATWGGLVQSRAARALGRIADPALHAWLQELALVVNYLDAPTTLYSAEGDALLGRLP